MNMKSLKFTGAFAVAAALVGAISVASNPDYFMRVSARANAAFAVDPLIAIGASKSHDNFSDDPLWIASMRGSAETVHELFAAGYEADSWNNTALMVAASNGHIEVVDLLIESGADKNARGGIIPQSVLEQAAARGNAGVVDLLIERGVDLGDSGVEAAKTADISGHPEIAQKIRDASGRTIELNI